MKCLIKTVLLILGVMSLFACSNGNDRASNIDPSTGKHPAGWVVALTGGNHPDAYLNVPSSCFECHGKDLAGGISNISCFSASRNGIACHPGGPSNHPAGWADADSHGAAAKTVFSGRNGMAHCQRCHGTDFSGTAQGPSCLNNAACHGAGILSAHSPAPWLSKIGGRTHHNADASNAGACAVCHANGANSARQPSPAAPAGAAPGCFNNTLCHGVEGHEPGWNAANQHGTAAKDVSGGSKGFSACTQCHGAQFNGGTSDQSCLNTAGCHGATVAAPHPVSPWKTVGGVSHTSTDTSNAGQCVPCHTNGANSTRAPRPGDPVGTSSCFNNTLCHGTIGHAAGWNAPALHGAEAKKAPTASTGFSSCQPCHGTAFNNGSAVSCMKGLGCHGLLVNSPHPAKPWTSSVAGAPTHTTTDTGNVGTCAICHTGGANSDVKPPAPASGAAGCFNNTLCHFHVIPYTDPAAHGAEAKKNLLVCRACHGTSFSGGSATTACSNCHTAARAHPTDWQGSGTFSHRTAGNIANACSICHNVTTSGAGPLAGAPSCLSATFTNADGQVRTCHASGPGNAPHPVPYNNHNATARTNIPYCLGCHQVAVNATTASGKVIPRCLTCHLSDPTVTSTGCTSCHAKPPSGTTYPNIAAVHAAHGTLNVTQNTIQTAVCDQCHSGIGFGTVDHLNRARARSASVQTNPVIFGTLAKTGSLTPTYTAATQTCASTYCHGNTLDKPASAILSPSWTTPFLTGNATIDCTRCHGYPPATTLHAGKIPTDCIGCHPHVNPSGNGFDVPTKHIDGSIDASSAHGFPNPGSLHKSAANGTGCRSASCHPTDAAGSPYPVAAGTPPNCRACHLTNSPSTDPHCSDCHGSAGNDGAGAQLAGRPLGGTTFPNRPRRHNIAEHSGETCLACHPFTSGDPRHGWKNREPKSTSAQVGGPTTLIPSWDPVTKTCTADCHDDFTEQRTW